MRLLHRHSEEAKAADTPDKPDPPDKTAAPEKKLAPSAGEVKTQVTEEPTKPPAAPEQPETRRMPRLRRQHTVTVPVTVPRQALRRTVSVPSGQRALITIDHWNPATVLGTVAGGALAVVGLVALIRAGVNDTWFRPQVEVLNADHTALLGAIEVGAGALLLLLGVFANRVLVALAGLGGALAATAAAVSAEDLTRELAIEPWWAWVLAGTGALLTVVALQIPQPRPDTVLDV